MEKVKRIYKATSPGLADHTGSAKRVLFNKGLK